LNPRPPGYENLSDEIFWYNLANLFKGFILYELFETLQAISLGLFVNSSYAIMIGDEKISNWYISIVSVISIYIMSKLKRRFEKWMVLL